MDCMFKNPTIKRTITSYIKINIFETFDFKKLSTDKDFSDKHNKDLKNNITSLYYKLLLIHKLGLDLNKIKFFANHKFLNFASLGRSSPFSAEEDRKYNLNSYYNEPDKELRISRYLFGKILVYWYNNINYPFVLQNSFKYDKWREIYKYSSYYEYGFNPIYLIIKLLLNYCFTKKEIYKIQYERELWLNITDTKLIDLFLYRGKSATNKIIKNKFRYDSLMRIIVSSKNNIPAYAARIFVFNKYKFHTSHYPYTIHDYYFRIALLIENDYIPDDYLVKELYKVNRLFCFSLNLIDTNLSTYDNLITSNFADEEVLKTIKISASQYLNLFCDKDNRYYSFDDSEIF